MKTNKTQGTGSYSKRILIDVVKVLLFLVIFSTLFHNKLAAAIDSISDFAFHHIFLTTFGVLIVLALVIEFDVFHGDHFTRAKEKLQKDSDENK